MVCILLRIIIFKKYFIVGYAVSYVTIVFVKVIFVNHVKRDQKKNCVANIHVPSDRLNYSIHNRQNNKTHILY